MRAEYIETVLRTLGARKIKNKGVKVTSTCPLASWRHASGKDEHPSFVITVAENDESRCSCLSASCRFRGSLTQLIWAYTSKSGIVLSNLTELIQKHDQPDIIARLEKIQASINPSKSKNGPGYVTGGVEVGDLISQADKLPWLEAHSFRVQEMQRMLDKTALDYLHGPKRRISDASIERWRLGWHPGAQRISVPQYDRKRRLVNIGGRYVAMDHDDPFWTPPPWMHAKDFKKEMYLFGEDKFESYDGTGTIVLVEGMFDAISLDGMGVKNVAAMLGAFLSRAQYTKIVSWFNRLVIVPDGDPPGFEAADRIVNMIGRKIAVDVFPTPQGKDPDELTINEINTLKRDFLFDNK